MKTLLILTMAAVAFSLPAADTNQFPYTVKKTAATQATTTKVVDGTFVAKEFNFETAYTMRTEDFGTYGKSGTIGGNFFLTRELGLHAGMALTDLNDQGIDLAEFGLTGRLPLGKSRFALIGGAGAERRFVIDRPASKPNENGAALDAREDSWAIYAEGGLLYRAGDHVDFFAKIRGVRPVKSAVGEHVGIFLGVDFPFSLGL
jgi:hypothetical protein